MPKGKYSRPLNRFERMMDRVVPADPTPSFGAPSKHGYGTTQAKKKEARRRANNNTATSLPRGWGKAKPPTGKAYKDWQNT